MNRTHRHSLPVAVLLVAATLVGRADASDVFRPGAVVHRVPVNEKLVALTFDDGPRAPFTGEILDVLAEQGVRATFFLIGSNALREPALAKRIVREGHAVGNHGWAHRSLVRLSGPEARAEVERGAAAIRRVTGVHPRILRPPFGAFDTRIAGSSGLAADLGQTLIMWSVETRDWATRSPLQVAAGTLRRVHPGAIVLLHDGGGDRSHVVTATRWLVGHLARDGYRFVTVPELLERSRR
jgi:peptidoglycan/xylan/chitin deacetylase (PgdA/CDA1 family)